MERARHGTDPPFCFVLICCDVRLQARPRFRILRFSSVAICGMEEVLALFRSEDFWTSLSFYIHLWPLDGSKMVRSDWSLPVPSGCCRFDPYEFEACVVFSKGFIYANFTP